MATIERDRGHAAEALAVADRVSHDDLDESVDAPIDFARLADVYIALGHHDQAAAALGRAQRALVGHDPNPAQKIAVSITAGRVNRAAGRIGPTTAAALERARSEATRLGLLPQLFDARLMLAEQAEGARRATSLAELEKDATHAGFIAIAKEAARLSATRFGSVR